MLTPYQIDLVKQELAKRDVDGPSIREIARKLKISRVTIAKIANGKYFLQKRVAHYTPVETPLVTGFGRCPECGRLLELPCRVCVADQEGRHDRTRDPSHYARKPSPPDYPELRQNSLPGCEID